MKNRAKRLLRRLVKQELAGKRDRLTHGLIDGRLHERYRYDFDGVTAYGFVNNGDFVYQYNVESTDQLTDDEIDEWFDRCMAAHINSPYDCTGRLFTFYIDWHRNPCGAISYVHRMVYDW